MSALLIAYDLNKPGQNYTNLFKAIEALGRNWHYLNSTWIVVSSLTPNQAYDNLTSHIDSNDGMLVMNGHQRHLRRLAAPGGLGLAEPLRLIIRQVMLPVRRLRAPVLAACAIPAALKRRTKEVNLSAAPPIVLELAG